MKPSCRKSATKAGQLCLRVYTHRPKVQDHGDVPADSPKLVQRIVTPKVVRGLMRLLAALGPRVVKLPKKQALVARYDDVQDLLRRDADFRIAPINATRIEGVMGPFILGMDGGPALPWWAYTAERKRHVLQPPAG